MDMFLPILASIIGVAGGFAVGYFISGKIIAAKIVEAESRAKHILEDAEKDAQAIKKERLLEAKDEWHKKKLEFDKYSEAKSNKLHGLEKNIEKREESIATKLELINRKEKQLQLLDKELNQQKEVIAKKLQEAETMHHEQNRRLERITGMTKDDAKKLLVENLIEEAKIDSAQLVKNIRDEARDNAKREAQKIVVQAIQRTASDHSIETTVSVVNLASEDMKGRIIGREGRNIRAFEAATGVDLIIDDTPEAVIISGFDPFRREVARIALEQLMNDGRIHPTRIEEIVDKVTKELEEDLRRTGENTLLELGLHTAHAEILKLVGRMKYRSSYGQNLLSHSIEVAHLCGIMAAELGLDIKLAKRAGILHDMGKCVDRSIEGPHALIGYEIAKKHKENRLVANAIGAHHDEIEMESPYAVLVQAADGISGARPGARRESLDSYIKRLEKLEGIAQSYTGVTKTYAIQAGREVRVIVEPEVVNDLQADMLANDISVRIQNELEYPGQIRVTVVRERRSVAFAK